MMGSQRIWGREANLRGYKQEYIFPATIIGVGHANDGRVLLPAEDRERVSNFIQTLLRPRT